MGMIALAGGSEFRPACAAMDRRILGRIARPSPRVVILPTAAVRGSPRMAAENGMRHFNSLGANAAAAMVITREDAQNPAHVNAIKDADLIYLAGGEPPYLLNVLQDTLLWDAILAMQARGGVLAGSSAGAMVLAAKMRAAGVSGEWMDALNIVPRVVVIPHHQETQRDMIQAMQHEVNLTLLGIDEATACISEDLHQWMVVGVGGVTVYRADGISHYASDESFTLAR
ncbi:MAG: Type 1 glutamine amidotransferase-like domain-containing protein [Anaerolineae bacterium]|nr:Type 1 glutamine amidotransferase-like domain-containing protein [Anaerolineae bacterium]